MTAASIELEKEQAYLAALREFYHPVATLQELQEVGTDEHGMQRVLAKELLGERIVIARLQGEVVVMHGTCPRRGAGPWLGQHRLQHGRLPLPWLRMGGLWASAAHSSAGGGRQATANG
jgi:hypothetical protein